MARPSFQFPTTAPTYDFFPAPAYAPCTFSSAADYHNSTFPLAFPSPIPTQIDPNWPLHAAIPIYGDLRPPLSLNPLCGYSPIPATCSPLQPISLLSLPTQSSPANPAHPSSLPSPTFLTTASKMQSFPALTVPTGQQIISSAVTSTGIFPGLASFGVFGNTATSSAATPAPTTTPSAEAQAHAEADVSELMPCVVLDIKRRLDEHEVKSRRSFDYLQGELSKLKDRLSSLTTSTVNSPVSNTTTAPVPSVGLASSSGSTTMAASAPSVLYAATSSPASSCSSPIGASTTAYVAPHVFGEMPEQYGFHNLSRQTVFLADGIEHSYYVLPEDSPAEQVTTPMSPLVAENVGVTPQPSEAANAADTSNVCKEMHVYDIYEEGNSCLNCIDEQLARPFHKASENAFSEDTPEQVSNAYAVDTKGCTDDFVGVFAGIFEQQPHEDAKSSESLEELPSESIPNYDVYDTEDSACINIISDLRDFSLELQQQDDERACNCPVLKAYYSDVTRSTQLCTEPSVRELRLLWDPGASAFLVTPLNNSSSKHTMGNEHDKTDIWSQSEHQFIVLQGVFDEAMLDIPPAKPPEKSLPQGILMVVLKAENSSAHTQFNFLSYNSKQILVIQAIQFTCYSRAILPWQGGTFSLENFDVSTLRRNTIPVGDKIFGGLNLAANSQNLFPCISTNDTEHTYVLVKLLPWGISSAQHILDPSMIKSYIFSARLTLPWNPWYGILLLQYCLREFSISSMKRVPWDPGVKVSFYCWLNILTIWSEIGKPLSCTHVPELATWQNQATSASYVWDPGTILWYTSTWLVLFTVSDILYAYYFVVRHCNDRSIHYIEKIMCYFTVGSVLEEKEILNGLRPMSWSSIFQPMQYSAYFHKCNALSIQWYTHQGMNLYGIPLWLINFQVP